MAKAYFYSLPEKKDISGARPTWFSSDWLSGAGAVYRPPSPCASRPRPPGASSRKLKGQLPSSVKRVLNLPEENAARPSHRPEAKEEGTGRTGRPESCSRGLASDGNPGVLPPATLAAGVTAGSSPLGKEEAGRRLAGRGEPVFLPKLPPQSRLRVPFRLFR